MVPSEPGSANAGAASPGCRPADGGACAIATAATDSPVTIIVAIIIRITYHRGRSLVTSLSSPIRPSLRAQPLPAPPATSERGVPGSDRHERAPAARALEAVGFERRLDDGAVVR